LSQFLSSENPKEKWLTFKIFIKCSLAENFVMPPVRGWSNKYNIYVWEQPLVGSGSFNNVGSTALYRQHDCNVECKDDLDLGVTQAMRSIKESGIQ